MNQWEKGDGIKIMGTRYSAAEVGVEVSPSADSLYFDRSRREFLSQSRTTFSLPDSARFFFNVLVSDTDDWRRLNVRRIDKKGKERKRWRVGQSKK